MAIFQDYFKTMLEVIKECSANALQCGAIFKLKSVTKKIECSGFFFDIKMIDSLSRKELAKKRSQIKGINPFLPYDKNMFVSDISNTHVMILNKFNIIENHLLIITKEFEKQDSFFTQDDFNTLFTVMMSLDSPLIFYNSSKMAGASQPHKHFQVIPSAKDEFSFNNLINTLTSKVNAQSIPDLSFKHAIFKVEAFCCGDDIRLAVEKLKKYLKLDDHDPFNLILTKKWLYIIPRSTDKFENISVNALGFMGSLLVKNNDEFNRVLSVTPIKILEHVGYCIK